MLWILVPKALDGNFTQLAQVGWFSLFSSIVAVPFVILVGIPASIWLRNSGRYRWKYFAAIGFIAAALPMVLFTPGGDPGYSSGGNFYGTPVDYIVKGVPTIYGWLSYMQGVVQFGLHGLLGATAFYIASKPPRAGTTAPQSGAVA
jgi:hypothetical protein